MEIGLIGLGKMGGNMRTRLRNAGHTVVGYDRNPDVADVGVAGGARRGAALAEGGLGDGPRGRPDPADGRGARRPARPRATSSSTAATPAGPTTSRTPSCSAEKGIGYVDCGVSGGVWGLENGYALMYGGAGRRHRQGAAGLRRAQARGRLRLRARRRGGRRPLLQDGPQRHRVRHHAGLRRGLGAARDGRHWSTTSPRSSAPGARAP